MEHFFLCEAPFNLSLNKNTLEINTVWKTVVYSDALEQF